MTMTLEQLHDWITRLPEPFGPVKRQTDAIEAAIRERDRLRGDVAGMTEELLHVPSRDDWRELQQRAERAGAELAALKARIADAPVVTINDSAHIIGDGYVPSLRGKRVRLVVED